METIVDALGGCGRRVSSAAFADGEVTSRFFDVSTSPMELDAVKTAIAEAVGRDLPVSDATLDKIC